MTVSINFNDLFDADTLLLAGESPWTIFAYPTSLADSDGLPPDADAIMLFVELQKRRIPMAIWVNGIATNTTYFACRFQDRSRVDDTIMDLESQGVLEPNYLSARCNFLFSLVDTGT